VNHVSLRPPSAFGGRGMQLGKYNEPPRNGNGNGN
jgi:hypothetical protein